MTRRRTAFAIAALLGVSALWLRGDAKEHERASQLREAEGPSIPATAAPSRPLVSSAAVPQDFPGSHPLTPERQWIHYENALIGALYDALDTGDAARIRELVATYRETQPDDEHALQQGFELIADCLEAPDGTTRASAAEYYERERASTVRRYVRRLCLEARERGCDGDTLTCQRGSPPSFAYRPRTTRGLRRN